MPPLPKKTKQKTTCKYVTNCEKGMEKSQMAKNAWQMSQGPKRPREKNGEIGIEISYTSDQIGTWIKIFHGQKDINLRYTINHELAL